MHENDLLQHRRVFCELNGRQYWLYSHEGMCRNILRGEEWEPHIRAFLEAFLKEGDVVIDAGAAFGVHTVTAARCVGSSGVVVAFEPQPQFLSLLEANCQANSVSNVEIYPCALGRRTERVGLRPVSYDGPDTPMADVFLVKPEQATQVVQCIALDDLVTTRNVALLKLDVQGAEVSVLLGAERFLREQRPYLIVEFEDHCLVRFGTSSAQLFHLLRERNYYPIFLDYTYPSDHLCVPMEKYDEFIQRFGRHISPHTEFNPINQNVLHGVTEKLCLR